MVELKKLTVEPRNDLGKRRIRRMRAKGKIPAVLYGHKQPNVVLTVSVEDVEAVLRHGSRFVILEGAVNERAFIKECQWDTWGVRVLHVDFTRVSEHERVRLSVPLELRGEAQGTKEGGVILQNLHTIEVECEPAFAPEKIVVKISGLGFEESIKVADVEFPEGVTSLVDSNAVIVECVPPMKEKEETEVTTDAGSEPEVIGRKKEEEEAEEK